MSNLRYTRGSFLSTLYLTRPGASGKRGRGPRARGRAHVRKTSTPKPVPAVVGEWGGIARLPARHSRAWMPLFRQETLQAKHSRACTPLFHPETGPHLSETLACMDAFVSPEGRSPSARDVWKVPRRRHLAAGSAGFGVDMRLSGGWDGGGRTAATPGPSRTARARRAPQGPRAPGAAKGPTARDGPPGSRRARTGKPGAPRRPPPR